MRDQRIGFPQQARRGAGEQFAHPAFGAEIIEQPLHRGKLEREATRVAAIGQHQVQHRGGL